MNRILKITGDGTTYVFTERNLVYFSYNKDKRTVKVVLLDVIADCEPIIGFTNVTECIFE